MWEQLHLPPAPPSPCYTRGIHFPNGLLKLKELSLPQHTAFSIPDMFTFAIGDFSPCSSHYLPRFLSAAESQTVIS